MSATITLIGNLGADAETRTLPSGTTLTTLNVAHTPREKKNGEWTDGETMWFRVTVWSELPALVYAKGARVIVAGTLSQNTYTAKDGSIKTSLEVKADSVGITHRIVHENDVATTAVFDAPVPITYISDINTLITDAPF